MTSTAKISASEKRQLKRADPSRVSFGRLVAWSSSHAAQGANFLTLGFFSIYCTDTLGLSAPIVGLLLLISRIVDAVGALVAGYLVDVAPKTRFGKARPFDLAIVGIWGFTAIMFSTPGNWGDVSKYVWVFATYLLVTAVFTPLFNANQPLYMARAFGNRDAYARLSARSGLIIGVVSLAAGVTVPLLVNQAGKSPTGWSIIMISIAVPLGVFGLVRFFFIREKFETEAATSPRIRVKDIFLVLRTNPYLWLVAIIQLIGAIVGNVGVGAYYFRYIVHNVGLLGILGILNILVLPLIAALPPLIRRFSVSRVITVTALIGAVGYSVFSFAGAQIPLLVVGALLTAIGSLPTSFLITILIIDNATYNEWKGHRRLESVGGGIGSFAMSTGSGVAAGLAGLVLGLVGYDGTRSTQTPGTITGIIVLTSWIPAAFSILLAVVALFYHRFERRLPAITASIQVRRHSESVQETAAPANANSATPLLVAGNELAASEQAARDATSGAEGRPAD